MIEVFEHTADVGIRVRASSLEDLFAEAAQGLFSVLLENPDAVENVEETTVELHAEGIEELLHDWLAELLYLFSARRFAAAEFAVRLVPPCSLAATVRGEPVDLERHKIDVEAKAITWHELKVEQRGSEWLGEVIVDI